jgi:hypothetical protein
MSANVTARSRLPFLAAVAALGLIGLLVGLALRPGSSSTPSSPPGAASLGAVSSAAPTPFRSAGPDVSPSEPPGSPLGPCRLPVELPVPEAPIAAPRTEGRNVAMLFTSYLYERSPEGRLFAQDSDAKYGLWFAPPRAAEARLLVATDGGVVLPLGLSSSGDTAAVWYLPEWRAWGEPTCLGGIYLLSTADGTGRLVLERDWRVVLDDSSPGRPNDRVGQFWPAGQTETHETVVHRLPEASFSADGRSVALVDRDLITVIGPGKVPRMETHAGECSSWGWSPSGATFVAGCEEMTSAWTIDVGQGFGEEFYPLPLPKLDAFRNWEQWPAAAIGFLPSGEIRLVRFYGFATGCEGPPEGQPPCFIPRPAWSATTIEPISGQMRSRVTEVEFLVDVDEVGRDARLSADGSWVYIRTSRSYSATSTPARARTISPGSGEIVEIQRLGEPVGRSFDGRLLFETRADREQDLVLVRSLNRTGAIRQVGTIAWPEGVDADTAIIRTFGLVVSWLPNTD